MQQLSVSEGAARKQNIHLLLFWSCWLWCGLQSRFILSSWLFQQQMKPLKPLSRQTHQLIGQRTISLSQQLRALPRFFQMTFIGAANFTNNLYFDGLEQNNYARLPSEKPEMKTSDLAITGLLWKQETFKRQKKWICMCIYSSWNFNQLVSNRTFYNFHKWY